ncbi:MAG TPA: Lrp/AsnC family transcriptional regulator [Candidatus Dormibacteraeota bacterium]|nr:Lrp/AsnC family transcriptional regulator [Candidatus Dormibacteraeota bacterium]
MIIRKAAYCTLPITVEIILKTTDRLDVIDRRLLEKAQDEFPLAVQPWASIGDDLGITEKEVMRRLRVLFRRGVVRKIGPALDARRVGLRASTLIAMKVPENRIQNVAKIVGKYREVSHCYQREHQYNFWFTIAARNEPELGKIVEQIRRAANIPEDEMLDLPSTRIFKIDVRFQLTSASYS